MAWNDKYPVYPIRPESKREKLMVNGIGILGVILLTGFFGVMLYHKQASTESNATGKNSVNGTVTVSSQFPNINETIEGEIERMNSSTETGNTTGFVEVTDLPSTETTTNLAVTTETSNNNASITANNIETLKTTSEDLVDYRDLGGNGS